MLLSINPVPVILSSYAVCPKSLLLTTQFGSTKMSWSYNFDELLWITVSSWTSNWTSFPPLYFKKIEVQLMPSKFNDKSLLFTCLVLSCFWVVHFGGGSVKTGKRSRYKNTGTSVLKQARNKQEAGGGTQNPQSFCCQTKK